MVLNYEAADRFIKSHNSESEKPQVLLVDDESANLLAIGTALEADYAIVTCRSALEALEIIAGGEHNFKVVIADHVMPGMTGVAFCSELRRRQHHAPRIIVTAFAELSNVMAAVNEAAIFRYLSKPLDTGVLLNVVAEAVKVYDERQQRQSLMAQVKDMLERTAELSKNLEASGLHDAMSAIELPEAVRPQRQDVAVLVMDVRGFTQLSSKTPAEEVIGLLRRLFAPVHEIIYDSGGIVDKHLGDGLIGVFGLSGQTAVDAALGATRRIVNAYPSIVASLGESHASLKVSLGVAAGEVLLGMMGSEHRSELSVMGKPVNLAVRLQELSKVAMSGAPTPLGEFENVIALCDASMMVGNSGFRQIQLDESLTIRDFPDVRSVGLLKG
ncbi:MAG: response regulator [Myxococcota bacterium]|nr:response regulator [Myxococcota bacterium]